MTSRTPMDAAFLETRDRGTEGLELFAANVPDVRSPAPSAPGSASSELAAKALSGPFRRKSWRKIMLVLGAASGPMSMHEISVEADIPINVVCARIPELEPLWIARTKDACLSHVKPNLKVDGFALTPAGRARLSEAA